MAKASAPMLIGSAVAITNISTRPRIEAVCGEGLSCFLARLPLLGPGCPGGLPAASAADTRLGSGQTARRLRARLESPVPARTPTRPPVQDTVVGGRVVAGRRRQALSPACRRAVPRRPAGAAASRASAIPPREWSAGAASASAHPPRGAHHLAGTHEGLVVRLDRVGVVEVVHHDPVGSPACPRGAVLPSQLTRSSRAPLPRWKRATGSMLPLPPFGRVR